jgi:hypothetical protein
MIGCTMHDPASALVDSGSEIVNSDTASSMQGRLQATLTKTMWKVQAYLVQSEAWSCIPAYLSDNGMPPRSNRLST